MLKCFENFFPLEVLHLKQYPEENSGYLCPLLELGSNYLQKVLFQFEKNEVKSQ